MVICKTDDAGVERPIWNTVEPGILLTIRVTILERLLPAYVR